RLQSPRHADSVATHEAKLPRTVLRQKRGVEFLAVFCAEFEYVADLNCAADFQRFAALGARFAGSDRPQVCPFRHLNVAFDGNIFKMETILICAGRRSICAAQTFINKDGEFSHAHRTQTAGTCAERVKNFLSFSRTKRGCAE